MEKVNKQAQDEAVQQIYNYAIELKKSGNSDKEAAQALMMKGLDEESANIVVNNVNQAASQPQPVEKEGSGFPSILIYILILVLINVLSAAFDWGFWIY